MIKKFILSIILLWHVHFFGGAFNLYGEEGDAGTLGVFSVGGVGARAMGLGNAYVAMPLDATAIYWNPAGLEYLPYKSISIFYTNLLAGTQYNFVGYVHPTVNVGTFGIGAIRIGTDYEKYDEQAVGEGNGSYQESQFLFSYAKKFPFNLSAGISMKLHYFSMNGSSDTGIGADLGLLYRLNFDNAILRDMAIGMNFHNILQPRLNPVEDTDVHPYSLKFGVAKPLRFDERTNRLILFLDFEQGGGHSSFKYHMGTEYVFQERAMLRLGMNNNQFAFGAGFIFNILQLDYSYGKFADHELNASHRISLTFNIGKSRDEMVRIAEEKKLLEIDQQVSKKIEWERNERIAHAMEDGKRFMQDEDYLRAQREFNIIIGFEREIPDALEIRQAKELLALSTEKYKEQTEKAIAEIQSRTALERKKEEDLIFINEHFKRGLAFYENEEFENAISEWTKILDRDPENQLAMEHIKKARVDYSSQIYSLIKRADALGQQGKYVEAINVLNQAIGLNPEDQRIKNEITNRRSSFENKLSFYDLYQQGRNYQIRKEYKSAMEAYEKALAFDPNNKLAKTRYEEVKARAFAKREPITGPAKEEFLKSLRLINQGKYEEALQLLEALQKQQPYNKDILDAIDTASENIERQKR